MVPTGTTVTLMTGADHRVDLDGSVEDDVVRGLIEDSYDLVVARLPRTVRAELGLG
jgi:predicted DNA-binding protein (MmcQ/YjbR family)